MPWQFSIAGSEFLTTSDHSYDECLRGISELDRIIVGVPSILADRTRMYLLPSLYAYWERFFRTVFAEYLRCIGLIGIPLTYAKTKVAKTRSTRELANFASAFNISIFNQLAQTYSCAELKAVFETIQNYLNSNLDFPDPTKWVEADSNVKFKVLEKNCQRYGPNIEEIKNSFSPAISLFQELNSLVDARNAIAHGSNFAPLSSTEWESKKNLVIKLMQVLQMQLHLSLIDPTILTESIPPGTVIT
jgi:hypothetical protein